MHRHDAIEWSDPAAEPTATVDEGSDPVSKGEDAFFPGELVSARFQITRLLGRGGFGEVYEAWDGVLGQAVALKVLRPSEQRRWRSLEQIRQELLLARRVAHPGICRIHDIVEHRTGEGSGTLVLTMELLEGPTLAAWLQRHGPMPLEDALPWIRRLAEAIDAAHDAGVLHLDLKPGNVVLIRDRDGSDLRPVITDFGLARPFSADGAPGAGGTRGYMAPEQETGGELSRSTDVYGFGALIHKMLTGRRVLREPGASARIHGEELAPGVRRVLSRALATDPADRPPAARSLRSDLERLGEGETPTLLEETQRYESRLLVAVAVGVLLSLLAVFLGEDGSLLDGSSPPDSPDSGGTPEVYGIPPSVALTVGDARNRVRALDASAAVSKLESLEAAASGWPPFHAAFSDALWILGREDESRRHAKAATVAATRLPREERMLYEARLAERNFDWRVATRIYDALWNAGTDELDLGISLVDAHLRLGERERARAVIREIGDRFGISENPRLAVEQVRWALVLGGYEGSEARARRAVALARSSGEPVLLAAARRSLGAVLHQLGESEAALEELRAARKLFASRGHPSLAAATAWVEAEVYGRLLQDEAARRLYEECIGVQRRVGSSRRLAEVLHAYAGFELKRGEIASAEIRLEEAHDLFLRFGDLGDIAATTSDLGLLAMNRGDVEAAVEYYEKALDLDRRLGRKKGEIFVLNSLAQMYVGQGQIRRAQDAWIRARDLARELGLNTALHLPSVNLGELAWNLGDLEGAESHLEESLDAAGVDPSIRAHAYYVMAKMRWLEGEPESAETFFARAIALSGSDGDGYLHLLYRAERTVLLAEMGRRRRAADEAVRAWRAIRGSEMAFHRELAAASVIETLVRVGRPGEARRILSEIHPDLPSRGWQSGGVRLQAASARLLFEQGDAGRARELLRGALERTTVDRSVDWEIRAVGLLSEIETALGNRRSANEWHRRRRELVAETGLSVDPLP